MSTEILISLVEIIWMLMFASLSASNILEATPGLATMPEPTMEIFEMVSSQTMRSQRSVSRTSSSSAMAGWAFCRVTVKEISLVPSRPIDCRMMSTLILRAASSEKILKAMPGTSGTPTTEMRATSLSRAAPLINIFSTFTTSLTLVPLFFSRLESTSSFTLYFFAISTERLCSTCAPREASSSISS